MPFSYLLAEITLLGYPILVGLLCYFFDPIYVIRFLKIGCFALLPIDLLYISGYTLAGDYPNYIIYSAHYLVLCFWVINSKTKSKLVIKIGNIGGIITIIIGYITGLIGFVMFIVISQNWETDKQFYFTQNKHQYQVRRYMAGFATWINTEYTFETYRKYKYLPVEKKLDVSTFYDDQTNLDVAGELTFHFVDSLGSLYLVFRDTKGNEVMKKVK